MLDLLKNFKIKEIKIKNVFNEKDGIQFRPKTSPDEKTLRVVLRGIPKHVDRETVTDELKFLKFYPIKITRMYRKTSTEHIDQKTKQKTYISCKIEILLILVEFPRTEHSKNIYEVQDMFFIKIKVETQKSSTQSTQCHRCQGFGHTQ